MKSQQQSEQVNAQEVATRDFANERKAYRNKWAIEQKKVGRCMHEMRFWHRKCSKSVRGLMASLSFASYSIFFVAFVSVVVASLVGSFFVLFSALFVCDMQFNFFSLVANNFTHRPLYKSVYLHFLSFNGSFFHSLFLSLSVCGCYLFIRFRLQLNS